MKYRPAKNTDQELKASCERRNVRGVSEREIVNNVYMHGCCFYLAAALHLAYGFPICASIQRCRPSYSHETTHLFHAWVELPDGDFLDIQGVQTLDQMLESVRDCCDANTTLEVHYGLSLDRLTRFCAIGEFGRAELDQALLDAEAYLETELARYKRTPTRVA